MVALLQVQIGTPVWSFLSVNFLLVGHVNGGHVESG